MAKKQFYGIKYPFTTDGEENYFIDLNENNKDKIKSMLMHIIFTPKGQKLRDPEFGTDLIKYIFEPSDDISWDGIKSEVSNIVSKYLKNVKINDLSVLKSEEDFSEVYVRLDYTVSDGFNVVQDSIAIKL